MRTNEDIKEFATAINLLIERFVNPYKIGEYNKTNNNQVNDMEYEINCNRNYLFSEGNRLDVFANDQKRVGCNKTKFWPKDYEVLEIEKAFSDYLDKVYAYPALFFALHFFESLVQNFFKRRDFINKKILGLTKEVSEGTNIPNAVINQPKSKKIIDDDLEDFPEEENYYKKDNFALDSGHLSNNNLSNYYFDEPATTRRLRTRASVINGQKDYSENINKKKRTLEWNETCYLCGDFGELICCEECPNVSHLMCASLNVCLFYKF